jgi:hypothetical protein
MMRPYAGVPTFGEGRGRADLRCGTSVTELILRIIINKV